MDAREKIIALLRVRGPSLPYAVSKEIGGNTVLASAYLSELKDKGRLRMSHLKVGGGSPLYYLEGQEDQLQRFADNLNEKEKKVYDLLKQKHVLKDTDLVPVFRAAIRTIKDFAVPITVTLNTVKELFWKWYTLSAEETNEALRELLGIRKQPKVEETLPKEDSHVARPPGVPLGEAKEKRPSEQGQEKQASLPFPKEEGKIRRPSEASASKASPPPPKQEKKEHHANEFYHEIMQYFRDKNISVLEENVIRKTDIECVVEVPSPAGELRYFVKAKSKKRVTDGDLSSLFVQSQGKRLPAIFLSKGQLTKKAEEMLQTEFRGMKFTRI